MLHMCVYVCVCVRGYGIDTPWLHSTGLCLTAKGAGRGRV
jgi:hypothetical protein